MTGRGRPKLILLDRDGVLNVDRPEGVKAPAELVFIPGSLHAVALLNAAGYTLAIVTNQANLGRDLVSEATLVAIHEKLRHSIEALGGKIAAIYVAPEAPEAATNRRKPGPGMLLEAMREFVALPAETLMIGDSVSDAAAAKAAGVAFWLVRTGKGAASEASLPRQDYAQVVADLAAAADILCRDPL